MAQIPHFKEINEFTGVLGLDVKNKIPDFVIYDYEKVNHDGYNQLSTFSHSFYEINFELKEGCSVKVGQFELPAEKNRLTLISPHRLQSITGHSNSSGSGYQGFGLVFTQEFLNADVANLNLLKDFPYFNPKNSPAISISNEDIPVIVDLMNKIYYEYQSNEVFSKEVIKNYLNILFFKATKSYRALPDINRTSNSGGREWEIFQEFELLIGKHFLELNTVKDYAEKLHVTSKHLSETVKKVSGRSALQFIHEAQINYAKALLLQTNKTVSEIAYELNFEYPDYFSLFFKRLTGKSPGQYRNYRMIE